MTFEANMETIEFEDRFTFKFTHIGIQTYMQSDIWQTFVTIDVKIQVINELEDKFSQKIICIWNLITYVFTCISIHLPDFEFDLKVCQTKY